MASGEVLKEYLVGLGFQVDEASLKRWGTALGGTTGAVLKFAGVVTTAAAATFAFTDVITKRMEDLYWASQRIGSSANNIQSFELAIKKMGGTAEGARASLESLSQLVRSSPAMEAFINTLHVGTRNADGSMRDMTLVMRDLGQQFKQMPYWLANKWAQKLGIDEGTLWKMTHGLDAFGDSYGKLYKRMGIDPAQATKASKDFQNSLEDVKAIFDVLEIKVMTQVEPYMRNLVQWLEEAATSTGKAKDGFFSLQHALGNIGVAAGNLSELAKDLGTIASLGIALIASMPPEALELGMIGYFLFGKKIGFILAAVGDLIYVMDHLSGDSGKKGGREEYIKDAGENQRWDRKFGRFLNDHTKVLSWLFNSNDFNATYEEYKRRKKQGGGANDSTAPGYQDTNWQGNPSSDDPNVPPAPNGREPLGVRNNNPTNLRSWGDAPQTGGFAQFRTVTDGISAAAGNLARYSQRGWNTVSSIVAHWAPPGENNTAAYINDVASKLGVDSGQHLDLKNPGVMQHVIKALISHENGYNPYTDQQIAAGVNARMAMSPGAVANPTQGGAKTVTIQQHNEFHINGSGDAKSAVGITMDELGRVNGDLVRDTKSAVF